MTGRPLLVAFMLLVACSSAEGVDPTAPTAASADTTSPSGPSTGNSGASLPRGDGVVCWAGEPQSGSETVTFVDQTEALGMVDPLLGMYGHAAVWGDFNADQGPDLYVGTFADKDVEDYIVRGATAPSPDRLLLSESGTFTLAADLPDMFSRTAGGAAADLDNDGDLDLVVSRNFDEDTPDAPPSQVLRNDLGALTPVERSGLPEQYGGRSTGVLDFDSDGLYDLFIAEDRFSGGSSVLLRNAGDLTFEDVTSSSGIPTGVHGLGVAVADLSGDGFQDIFVAGSNRIFIADGNGAFREGDSTPFAWQFLGEEDDVAGVSAGDVNRDGRLDLLVGQHFNSTVDDGARVPVRLYLNEGADGSGNPVFTDITEQAGLEGLPTKAPHVEINDFDNDGWPDVMTTASASEGKSLAVFRHEGLEGGIPHFAVPEGLGSSQYWVAGPTADVDRDGRLDVFGVEWEPSLPSILFHNESASGHWLEVSVGQEHGFGIGWRVEVYEAGAAGDMAALIGAREITVTQGYSAGVEPTAHFGLGEMDGVDIRLVSNVGREEAILTGVPIDSHLRYPAGCR